MGLGPAEIAIILVLFFFLFGGKRLANFGKNLGEGLKNFKGSLKEIGKDEDES